MSHCSFIIIMTTIFMTVLIAVSSFHDMIYTKTDDSDSLLILLMTESISFKWIDEEVYGYL